jgi:hypothetical protein
MKKTKAVENFESSMEAILISSLEDCEAKSARQRLTPCRLCRSAFFT